MDYGHGVVRSELIMLLLTVATGECRVGFLRKRFESIMRDKSSKLQLLSGTEQFRKRIDKLLSWFLGMLHCLFVDNDLYPVSEHLITMFA